MKALVYLAIAAALLAAGAYVGRESSAPASIVDPYKVPPPPPGFVVDDNCPTGYMAKGSDCVPAPGYVVTQQPVAQQQGPSLSQQFREDERAHEQAQATRDVARAIDEARRSEEERRH